MQQYASDARNTVAFHKYSIFAKTPKFLQKLLEAQTTGGNMVIYSSLPRFTGARPHVSICIPTTQRLIHCSLRAVVPGLEQLSIILNGVIMCALYLVVILLNLSRDWIANPPRISDILSALDYVDSCDIPHVVETPKKKARAYVVLSEVFSQLVAKYPGPRDSIACDNKQKMPIVNPIVKQTCQEWKQVDRKYNKKKVLNGCVTKVQVVCDQPGCTNVIASSYTSCFFCRKNMTIT